MNDAEGPETAQDRRREVAGPGPVKLTRARYRLVVTTSGAFAEWAHNLAGWTGLPLSELVAQALIRWGEQSGYGRLPPRRVVYRRDFGADRQERREIWLAGQPGFKRLEKDPDFGPAAPEKVP